MRITRLEIFGFKSFVDRFVLNFDTDMIGIVGPNGCGKSNIVDALRWILGETHAKQLRGNVLDDLIFNGSDSRRPLGMAEVSITIRPDEHWTPAVAENTYRPSEDFKSGDSNSDEAPNETAAEDAAEPSVAELEAEQAANDVLQFPDSLLSIPGLFEAAELQLTRRLYRSGESEYFINKTPCRLRDMLELYRLIGLGARGLSIVQQGQIGQIVSKKPIERRELLEEAAGIAGIRARLEAAQRKLERTGDNLARLSDIMLEVDKQVRMLRRQAKRAEQRNELKAELRERDNELFIAKAARILVQKTEFSQSHTVVAEQLESKRNALLVAQADQEKYRSDLEQHDVVLDDLRRERDTLFRQLNEQRARESETRLSAAKLEGDIRALGAAIERSAERSLSIKAELAQLATGRETLNKELAAREGAVAQLELQLEELVGDRSGAEENSALTESSVQVARDRAQEAAMRVARIESEIAILAEHSNEMSSRFARLEQSAGQAGKSVKELLAVPEPLRAAVNALLGERADFIVPASGRDVFSEFRDEVNGDALGVVQPLCTRELRSQINGKTLLVDRLELPQAERAALSMLFEGVYLVSSLDEAREVVSAHSGATAVTENGTVVTAWGFFSFGENVLSAAERTETLKSELRSAEEDRAATAETLKKALSELNSTQRLAREREQLLQRDARGAAAELSSVRSRLRFELERVEALGAEEVTLEAERERLAGQRAQYEQERQSVGAAVLQEFEDPASATRRLVRDLEVKIEEREAKIHEQEKKRDGVRIEFSRTSQDYGSSRHELDRLSRAEAEQRLALERCDLELKMLIDEMKHLYRDELRLPGEKEVSEVLVRAEGDLEAYLVKTEDEVLKIRRRLEREGEVDPQAIEMCAQEEARLTQMQQQHEDLTRASSTLEKTIKQLKAISQTRFLETFASVSKKFEELVPRLFGGGAGHLELVDPGDPLTSGVELTVRPPGKKLRSMELLSGGEKALAATAILMSMFLHRPSPICVLDEVDAPLDDANLQRFLDMITEISSRTQFLVITHNKQSMAAVDRLIGITMQESGVSTALEVDFAEAEEELERMTANA